MVCRSGMRGVREGGARGGGRRPRGDAATARRTWDARVEDHKSRVGMMGFGAGGQLASLMGTNEVLT